MVVGVDVTHPAPGSGSDAKSIVAVMASTGIDFAQFSGCIRIQTGRVEMVEKLSMMMRARLELWKAKNNNVLPDRVVLFRDGVSEGQLETVLDKEKSQLDVLFGEMYRSKGKPIPKLTIIVVDKRHHIRFYQEKNKVYENPQAGTIVDTVVTIPRNLDFFLQIHHAIKGTAKWHTQQIETLVSTFFIE
jgi:hypothetical protein